MEYPDTKNLDYNENPNEIINGYDESKIDEIIERNYQSNPKKVFLRNVNNRRRRIFR